MLKSCIYMFDIYIYTLPFVIKEKLSSAHFLQDSDKRKGSKTVGVRLMMHHTLEHVTIHSGTQDQLLMLTGIS